jgi:predicted permease
MKPHLRLIAVVGLIVPRRLRGDWRLEWEAELKHREALLKDWDRLDWHHRLDLIRRSSSAFWDALWLQRRRLEDDMVQDVRFGLRMLRKSPAFTLLAVLTLALGIGANTAIFSLLDRALVRSLPVDDPGELVTFVNEQGGAAIVSYPLYVDLRDGGTDVLSGLAGYFQRPFSLNDGEQSERLVGQIVTHNYFTVVGVQPALGRFFLPEEDRTAGTHPVAVIGHGFWRRRFAADPSVIGRTLSLNAEKYTVIGVTPAEFTGTTRGTANDVYVPSMMHPQARAGARGSMLSNRGFGWMRLVGRRAPGVTREQAQAALTVVLTNGPDPVVGPGKKGPFASGVLLKDGRGGYSDRVADLAQPLTLLMGVLGLVLVIACANVANLLLARALARRKEIGVRLAVGASRWRLARQSLTEGTMLSLLGGAAGLLVSTWTTRLLAGLPQNDLWVPRMLDSQLDVRVMAFTLGVSVVTGIAFGLVPVLQAVKPDVVDALRSDAPAVGRGRRFGTRNLLVVTQVALSLMVLVGAGLFVKSLRALQNVDPGFEPAKVVTASFDLGLNGYNEARGKQFVADVTHRVASLPGVESASVANILAFSDSFWISGATIEGSSQALRFDFNAIGPNYFRTIGARLASGREFTEQDGRDAPPVVMVNEAAARLYWPGRDPVGTKTNRGEVVGVVANGKEKGLMKDTAPAMFLPVLQNYTPELTVHARVATDPAALIASLRRELRAADVTLPIYGVRTLAEQRDGALFTQRLAAAALLLFGLLALVLAAVGIYGMLSYAVTERTRELGIRLSQGAQPRDLIRLVISQGMLPTAAGLAIGVGSALALTRVIQGLLFGVSPTDPLTFTLIPLALMGVALVACWIPARRATRMDPVVALRCD